MMQEGVTSFKDMGSPARRRGAREGRGRSLATAVRRALRLRGPAAPTAR